MRVSTGLVAAALLAGALVRADASQSDSSFPLLADVLAAPSIVSYTGVVESVRMGSHSAEASVYRIAHRAPDLTRRTYSAPPQLFGDSEIIKGNLKFLIQPKHRRIVETRTDALGGREVAYNAALIRANYRPVRQGYEVFDGRPAVDVLLVNKHTNRATMLVRIDRATKIVLDKQEFGNDGALVSETRLEEVRFGPVSADQFALPKDYAVVRPRAPQVAARDPDQLIHDAGFAARKPFLPDGFSPLEGNLVEFRGVRTVQLLYSDGLRTISLFESATAVRPDMKPLHPEAVNVGNRRAEYAEDGTVALLTWNDGSLYYTLVGELGRAELAQLAAAITP